MIQAAAKPRYLKENRHSRPQLLQSLALVQCAMVQCANDRADRVSGVALHGVWDGVVEPAGEVWEAEAVSEQAVPKDGDVARWEGIAEYIESVGGGVGEGFGSA